MGGSFVCLTFAAAAMAMCLASPAFATLAEKDLGGYTFESYVKEFGKKYKDLDEYKMRREIFHTNLANAITFNTRPSRSYTMGINKFSDLTREEFNARYNGHRPSQAPSGLPRTAYHMPTTGTPLPESFSWKDAKRPVLTAVKNQGTCRSCWVFSAVESIESMHAMQTGELLNLSTQQVTSCAKNSGPCGTANGCGGGEAQLAWEYVKDAGGITLESDYPYTSGTSGTTNDCILNKSMPLKVGVSGYIVAGHNDAKTTMHALVHKGPLSISVDAGDWKSYHKGVFDGCSRNAPKISINHVVQLVGYGTDSKTGLDYWLVRNSWGEDWGEGGYIRLLRNKTREECHYDDGWILEKGCDNVTKELTTACGMCGLLYDVVYPIVTEVKVNAQPLEDGAGIIGIAGLVFGGIAFVMLIITVLSLYNRCRKRREQQAVKNSPAS